MAAVGAGLGAIALRKPDQDYDNEIKTEIIEGQEDKIEMNNRTWCSSLNPDCTKMNSAYNESLQKIQFGKFCYLAV